VQAAVSSFDSANRVMLDREVLLHFRDTATKRRVMDSVTVGPAACAQHGAGVTFWQ
jgi:hypothetical protein